MGKKYRDPDWLREQYVEKQRSLKDIASELGVDHTTVSKWRRRLDVPKPTAKKTLECPVCSKEFERTRSKIERAKHANVCSRECHYKARSEGIIGRDVQGGYDTEPTTLKRECENCGSVFHTTLSEDYKHCSRGCFLTVHSERMAGESNPAYAGGESQEKRSYRGPHWAKTRQRVYERDGYTCQRCAVKCISRRDYDGQNGGKLIQAHHIEAYEAPEDNTMDNLVTLCASCHGAVEGGADLNDD